MHLAAMVGLVIEQLGDQQPFGLTDVAVDGVAGSAEEVPQALFHRTPSSTTVNQTLIHAPVEIVQASPVLGSDT